jgi:predicted O-methyltransferase YrrM
MTDAAIHPPDMAREPGSPRRQIHRLRRDLWFLRNLARLPPRVARFQWRAWRLAEKLDDEFGRASATRPEKLGRLLRLAKGRTRVVELGTAMGWTAISLALADSDRHVVTYDPFQRPEVTSYLELVPAPARARVRLVAAPGDMGPGDERPVDLLYIDSLHDRAGTIREIEAWRPVLGAGAMVVLDDYTHPEFPGVREATEELNLSGLVQAGLFVHRIPDQA